jgi:hypothetical protein
VNSSTSENHAHATRSSAGPQAKPVRNCGFEVRLFSHIIVGLPLLGFKLVYQFSKLPPSYTLIAPFLALSFFRRLLLFLLSSTLISHARAPGTIESPLSFPLFLNEQVQGQHISKLPANSLVQKPILYFTSGPHRLGSFILSIYKLLANFYSEQLCLCPVFLTVNRGYTRNTLSTFVRKLCSY